jgi:hypothetical protein
MWSNDRKRVLLRLAYYACAIYAVSAAALLHWRMDEPILGYDPNHEGRSLRVFFLLVIAGFNIYAARKVNIDRNEAFEAMLRTFSVEVPRISASQAIRIRWAQIAVLVVMCSLIFVAR